MSEKSCFNCGKDLGLPHRGHCLQKLSIQDVHIGQCVRPIFDLTDVNGAPIREEETGIIERITRNTIHVRDNRGHLHKRYAYFFTTAGRPTVDTSDCLPEMERA